jgi:hypothetical protein
MISKKAFDQALHEAAGGSPLYGAAGSRAARTRLPIKAAPTDEEIEHAIRSAAERLRQHPELLSGDPKGDFNFEDPVLAAALYWLRKSQAAPSALKSLYGSAGRVPGQALKEGWYRPEWIKTGVKAIFSRFSSARVQLAAMTPDEPLRSDSAPFRVAVCGDAGFAGVAQDRVIRMILARHRENPFHFVIHLGDIYFAGDFDEMAVNFLNPFSKLTKAGMRLVTLVGNHDLYYGGTSFIVAMNVLHQPGRYFLIETPNWRIACLDTSLAATNLAGSDPRLDEKQLEWLDELLAARDSRPLVIMSHHFATSGWSDPPASLTSQISDRFEEKVFAWYWGHEHICALYEKNSSTPYWGACVGNGSFIEPRSSPSREPKPLWFSQKACTCYRKKGTAYRPHGYIELEFKKNQIEETCHLENRENHSRTLKL